MSKKKNEQINIIDIRTTSRNLGMSRGRITRNIQMDKVCDIRRFQLTFLLKAEDEAEKQNDFAKVLFSRF